MSAVDELARRLVAAGLDVRLTYPIGPLTTYRVGGAAAIGLEIAEAADLVGVGEAMAGLDEVATLVVGRGSNLLVADGGFDGLALRLGIGFESIETSCDADGGSADVRVGGAASLPVVARRTVAERLSGFEWAVGVPGSIGGAVRMNAGGHGSDMAASVTMVRVIDLRTGKDREMSPQELGFGYRRSAIASHEVVVEVVLRLDAAHGAGSDVVPGADQLTEIVRWRREHQPGGQNAGSVFTNPDGDSAGRLIDPAGCKSMSVGTASVSDKHANFILSEPGGSADDVAALMALVRGRVHDVCGVDLHAETVMVGFDPEVVAAAGGR